MKRIILTIVLLFFPLSNISAQWEIINEGFRGQINTIDFVSEDVGWIAGMNGTLVKTIDGGENWNAIPITESWHINLINFISDSTGWIAGNGDVLWKTNDGGTTWTQQLTNSGIGAIHIIDESNVYAVGSNKIYKTSNGGINWTDVSPNLLDRSYNSVWFQNSQIGVVTGNLWDAGREKAIILKTTNGGLDWNEKVINELKNVLDVQFLDSTNGYFRTYNDSINFICKTEDIFSSWSILTQNAYSIGSYQFLNKDTVYSIIGDSITANNLMKSIDGGINWQPFQSFERFGRLFSIGKIFFKKPDIGFALSNFGLISNYGSTENWNIKKLIYPASDVLFIDQYSGFLSGWTWGGCDNTHCPTESHIFYTSDGGRSWDVKFFRFGVIKYCAFITESIGYCETGSQAERLIFKSTDKGNNWTKTFEYNSDSTGFEFWGSDIWFLNEQNGFVVGKSNNSISLGAGILFTTDGGENWDLGWQFSDTNNYEYNLKSIHFAETAGWTVGDGGMIVKYTLQNSWVKQAPVTDLPLYKVFLSDDNHGWIAGGYQNENDFQNILLKTTNGGDNWEKVQNIPYLIKDIVFVDNNLGWAIGYDSSGVGGILKSTDGGITWTIETGNLPAKLNALHIKDNYGWAVGENGLILRTTNAGPTWVKDNNQTLPTEFVLDQNYPNPFNPTTKIKYTIPTTPASLPLLNKEGIEGWFVTLKVYDVLGREVATLVNEEKQPGVYEVEFNASNLSSGVYFYQLKVADPESSSGQGFIDTKKMILLR